MKRKVQPQQKEETEKNKHTEKDKAVEKDEEEEKEEVDKEEEEEKEEVEKDEEEEKEEVEKGEEEAEEKEEEEKEEEEKEEEEKEEEENEEEREDEEKEEEVEKEEEAGQEEEDNEQQTEEGEELERGEEEEEQKNEEEEEKKQRWQTLLKQTTVKQITAKKNRNLHFVYETDTLKHTLRILNKENILSVPVVGSDDSFVGFVDVLDIAEFVLHEWKNISLDLSYTLFPNNEFFENSIKTVLNYSKANTPTFVNTTDSIHHVIHMFRSPRAANKLHRVAVLDGNKMVDVISQSDIINFVYENISLFPSQDLSVEDAGIVHAPIMIAVDSSFADALMVLCKNKISGIALVDSEYKLTGNLSASDLRGIDPTCFEFFGGSVLQFLAKQTNGTKPTKFLKEGSIVEEVIEDIIEYKIHRLFITTDEGFPKGVVSLIDIIGLL